MERIPRERSRCGAGSLPEPRLPSPARQGRLWPRIFGKGSRAEAPAALLGSSWDSWKAESCWKCDLGQEFPGSWVGFYSTWRGGTWGHGRTGGMWHLGGNGFLRERWDLMALEPFPTFPSCHSQTPQSHRRSRFLLQWEQKSDGSLQKPSLAPGAGKFPGSRSSGGVWAPPGWKPSRGGAARPFPGDSFPVFCCPLAGPGAGKSGRDWGRRGGLSPAGKARGERRENRGGEPQIRSPFPALLLGRVFLTRCYRTGDGRENRQGKGISCGQGRFGEFPGGRGGLGEPAQPLGKFQGIPAEQEAELARTGSDSPGNGADGSELGKA